MKSSTTTPEIDTLKWPWLQHENRDMVTTFYPHIVIIMPAFKNRKWYKNSLSSALKQTYPNYHVIYADAGSQDGSFSEAVEWTKSQPKSDLVTFIERDRRYYPGENRDAMIRSLVDTDIVFALDADDELFGNDALEKVAQKYRAGAWVTYGTFKFRWGDVPWGKSDWDTVTKETHGGIRRLVPKWKCGHPRTFYAGLYRRINTDHLCNVRGNWLRVSTDKAMMLPLIEMAGKRAVEIRDVIYIYTNPGYSEINDNEGKINDDYIYNVLQPYTKLDDFPGQKAPQK